MFAVIRSGGKQYKVREGQELKLEKLEGEAGSSLTFDEVLLVGEGENVKVGTPLVEGASVQAILVAQEKGPKVIIFKKIRRQGKQLKKGHRQAISRVKITKIAA